MIIDRHAGKYIRKVQRRVAAGKVDQRYLTARCPECLNTVEWLNSDEHVVIPVNEYDTPNDRFVLKDWDVYVVIGCEGYWVINPRDVGVDSDTWQDWTKVCDCDPVTTCHATCASRS